LSKPTDVDATPSAARKIVQDCAAITADMPEYRKFATPQMRVWQWVMDYDWSYG